MSINVIGTLVDPMGEPMETNIRVTALNSNITVLSAEANKMTSATGDYDFTLVNGDFIIDVLIDDEYSYGENITVDSSTPTPIDLGTLLENHKTLII